VRPAWCLLLVAALGGCDPMLAMSSPASHRRTVEGCAEAVAHLKECCPRYETFVSCEVYDEGAPDLSTRQSRCVRERDCAAVEQAVTSGGEICGVRFSGRRCR